MKRRLENRFPNLDVTDFASIARSMEMLELSGSGRIVGEFEVALSEKFGKASAVATCSGTVSIYAALWALGIKKGDEVIIPPTAPIMSALPILHIGAIPVFSDVSITPGFGFDPEKLVESISPRTKAILAVPLWGYPIDMEIVSEIAQQNNVSLVEDVAQAHGSTWKGKYLGTFGDAGCFSTHERKLITTGEGGFILTDRADIAAAARVLVRYGIENNVGGVKLGSNYKLGAIPAALGLSQLAKLDTKISQRKRVGDQIRSSLSSLQWLKEFLIEPTSVHNG
jgi:perosamine synthetase